MAAQYGYIRVSSAEQNETRQVIAMREAGLDGNHPAPTVPMALTHTVTHTTKCVERFKEHRRGGFCRLSGIFASFFCLHDLCHETAHRLCGLVLLLPCSVGVGAERESGVIVAEHTADGFDVHAILQCQRCEGMSEIMKSDVRQPSILQDLLVQVYDGVWVVHLAGCRRGEHVIVWTMVLWGIFWQTKG